MDAFLFKRANVDDVSGEDMIPIDVSKARPQVSVVMFDDFPRPIQAIASVE
jgi:hypothetical protein